MFSTWFNVWKTKKYHYILLKLNPEESTANYDLIKTYEKYFEKS